MSQQQDGPEERNTGEGENPVDIVALTNSVRKLKPMKSSRKNPHCSLSTLPPQSINCDVPDRDRDV
jgi:hypothetical protein